MKRGLDRLFVGFAVVVVLIACSGSLAADTKEHPPGVSLYPELSLVRGDHRLDLGLALRYRHEYWHSPQSPGSNNIHGLRSTFGLRYSWKDAISLYVEGRDTRVFSLAAPPDSGGGASALYKAFTPGGLGGSDESAGSIRVSNGYLQVELADSMLRLGRVGIKMGTTLAYDEASWKYVKQKRMSQRLVGTVGWANAERVYDGGVGHFDVAGFHGEIFGAQPTTGVFDVSRAYRTQNGLLVYGSELTAKRGTWLDNAEVTAFFVGYQDARTTALENAGIDGKINLYTFGASLLMVEPMGSGHLDVMLWGAGQVGDYGRARQGAWAFLGEFGYQLDEVFSQPWLRVGINYASGDPDPSDGDRRTFFNLLPTNHLYYGYIDQLAFSNLVDFLVQLKLKPHPKLGLELVWHRFWLASQNDGRYFGTGAFSRDGLGFASDESGLGSRDVGNELDVVASVKLSRNVSLLLGVAQLWGGEVYAAAPRSDGTWAFTQVTLAY